LTGIPVYVVGGIKAPAITVAPQIGQIDSGPSLQLRFCARPIAPGRESVREPARASAARSEAIKRLACLFLGSSL
jgi:hypothetical protein